MIGKAWPILKSAGQGYVAHDSLSRGAAIAYYTVFSLAPVLVLVIAIAGSIFGEDAARGALVGQVGGVMGQQGAEALQTMIAGASKARSGYLAGVVGVVTLVITASGVFSEMQTALNIVWDAKPLRGTIWQMIRVRLLSLALVLSLGALLAVSLILSTALALLTTWLHDLGPSVGPLLHVLNIGISALLVAIVIGAIYKVLPDTRLHWHDVIPGAIVTALLFTAGKSLISVYIGTVSSTSTFGAAGTLAVLLLWIYYVSQIFLFGAEFTRAYGEERAKLLVPPPPATDPVTNLERRLEAARQQS